MLPRVKFFLMIISIMLVSFLNGIAPALANDVVVTTCTGPGLQTAWTTLMQNGGGTMTFNCGTMTIPVTATLFVDAASGAKNVTVDGGNLITLDGQNTTRIFLQNTWGNNGSTLNLQNITLTRGHAIGSGTAANGGAIRSINQSISLAQRQVLNINNVTFTNNTFSASPSSGDSGGAAIYSGAGFVNVTDSTFTGNNDTASSGAAIHILQSGLTIANTTFTNNVSTNQGGAIYIDGLGGASGLFSITGSTFTGNRSWNSGGAIYLNIYENTSAMTIDRTSFIDNGVNGGTRAEGGAIAGGSTANGAGTGNGIVRITNSLFANNFVDRPGTADGSGGALNFNQQAQVTIANSTFDGNRAEGLTGGANGGAIVIINNSTQFQIVNSTITNNFAGWVGGGIMSSANGRLRNTIIAYNSAANGGNTWNIGQQCSTELADDGTNLQYPPRNNNPNTGNETTCFVGKSAISQRGLPDFRDPLLNPLANNGGPTQTREPQASSPAIDYGSAATCAAAPINNLDQRGMPRPVDGDGLNGAQCDTGAFEYVSDQVPLAFNLNAPADTASLTGMTTMLSWSPSPFATQYHLLVDDDSNFSSPIVDTTFAGLTFTPAYLGVGQFYWQVVASNINGTAASATQTFTLNSAITEAPARNFTVSTPQTLTWSPVSWSLGYLVEVATDSSFTHVVAVSLPLDAGVLSYNVNLGPGIYYWRVAAKQPSTLWGTWSAVERFVVGGN